MVAATAGAQTDYDFLLKGGHVIDGKNGISTVRDVAIKDGRIAAVTRSRYRPAAPPLSTAPTSASTSTC
jgi:N-acyl-D-aspartate/D-glutamate deacylase